MSIKKNSDSTTNEHHLPLSLLETFVTFSKEKTTAKTAKLLKLTQPTVSRQLIQLENSLPQQIFRMKGRNKILTDYGLALARELEKYLLQMGKAINEVNQIYLAPEQLTIRVAARQEILQQYMFHFEFPGTVELIPLGTKEIVARIQAQTIDVAITHDISFTSDYIRKKYFTSIAKIVIPKKWFASKPTLTQWIKCCFDYPLAQYEGSYSHLDRLKDYYGIKEKFKINLLTQHWPLIEKRAAMGKSWAIIPSGFIDSSSEYYILDVPTVFEEQVFYIVYRKEFGSQDWFKKFLTSLY